MYDTLCPKQVILVRDADSKSKVKARVGQKAMVLTVVEAKGLEFRVGVDEAALYDAVWTSA